jgi:hypothetical protein
MRLSPQESERFYRIWFALLHYVNAQLQLVPAFPDAPGKEDVSVEITVQLRDALWANDALHERFMTDNPAQSSPADVALVASWLYASPGPFLSIALGNAILSFSPRRLRLMRMACWDW